VTLSALYAGAVGLDQALALVIGQNIGTATSSAVAAIGASSTAKRLAVAYIAFKLVAALIAIVLFPFVTPLIVRASQTIDSTGLLAAYHTDYNVIGVAVLLPLMGPFTVDPVPCGARIGVHEIPDPASLRSSPMVAVRVMRTVGALNLCADGGGLEGATAGSVRPVLDDATLAQASDGVRAASVFYPATRRLPTKATLVHEHRMARSARASSPRPSTMAKTGVAAGLKS
jgi:phosphate:Na+ symporter